MRVSIEFESVSSVGVCFFQTVYLSIVCVSLLFQFVYLFNSRLSIFLNGFLMRVSIEFESFTSVGVCFFQTEYLYIVCVSLLFQLCIFTSFAYLSVSLSDASFY